MLRGSDESKAKVSRTVGSIAEVGRSNWDQVANPGWPQDDPLNAASDDARAPYNPFLSFDFLDCLEQSGCASTATGWEPRHIILESDGRMEAAMPLYLKGHSMGEYVFDHGWADAYARAGGAYYPKLQASVPFTPATGSRLLSAAGPEAVANRRALAMAAIDMARRENLSSAHITFMPKDEWDLCSEVGYLKRIDQQFHFVSPGYRDFDDFLDSLVSRKRKALKRERREALSDCSIAILTGTDLTETVWDAFFDFYTDTSNRKWGRPYLNRLFFSMIGERMPDRILLVIAEKNGRPIAGALNFIGSHTLYGRHWGATQHQPFLHFELCYYQAIEWALAHDLPRVEAGAQGEHKLARGYVPTPTYSAHWITDPGFRDAVGHYLAQETVQV
ncbi:MAG: GNAT family N-acetyltransferase, partial [Alphaproteobacteria bacterium]